MAMTINNYAPSTQIDNHDGGVVEINNGKVENVSATRALTPGTMPQELLTEAAQAVMAKLTAAGYLDDMCQPADGMSQPQIAVMAHEMSERIWHATRWKPFETAWGLQNMKQAYQTALDQRQTYKLTDELMKALS